MDCYSSSLLIWFGWKCNGSGRFDFYCWRLQLKKRWRRSWRFSGHDSDQFRTIQNFKTFNFNPKMPFSRKNYKNHNKSEFPDFYEFILCVKTTIVEFWDEFKKRIKVSLDCMEQCPCYSQCMTCRYCESVFGQEFCSN